jgi:phosphoglycerate kinase
LESLIEGVALLENLRFSPGEESNDPVFGASLVKGFDAYVNEAFGASHRPHASIMFPPTVIPSAAGPNLRREVDTLLNTLSHPERPFVAIVGGAKVADKIGITKVLVDRADTVVIGGGMAFTFWKAMGWPIGDSLVDESRVEEVRELLATGRVLLPTDVWCLPAGVPFGTGGQHEPVLRSCEVAEGEMGLDVGPESIATFRGILENAATVLWNGPMGVFEDPRFERGTRSVAEVLASIRGTTVVGGGDSAAAVEKFSVADQMDFISTGGGASLELLEFGDLPGLRALRREP